MSLRSCEPRMKYPDGQCKKDAAGSHVLDVNDGIGHPGTGKGHSASASRKVGVD